MVRAIPSVQRSRLVTSTESSNAISSHMIGPFQRLIQRNPGWAQLSLVGSGLAIAVVGGTRVVRYRPPEHAFEPLVGFPVYALFAFWFGLGLFALSLALTNDAPVGNVAVFRFSNSQRSGLLASSILLVAPLVFGTAGLLFRPFFALAVFSAFFAFAATFGILATFVWRIGEILWAACPFGTPE